LTARETDTNSRAPNYKLFTWARTHAVLLTTCLISLSGLLLFFARNYFATQGQPTPPLDDSYIYFQYARNFAGGDLYAWIPDGGFTTGATSFLYVPLLALGSLAGLEGSGLFGLSMNLGWIFWAFSLWRMGTWSRTAWGTGPAIVGISLASTAGVVLWTMYSGMDGAFFLAYCVLTIEVALRYIQGKNGSERQRAALLITLLVLFPWARPEGMIFSVVTGIWVWWHTSPRKKARLIPMVAILTAALPQLTNLLITGQARSNGMATKSWLTDPTLSFSSKISAIFGEFQEFLGRHFSVNNGHSLYLLAGSFFLILLVVRCRKRDPMVLLGVLAVVGILLSMQSNYANVHRNRYQAPFFAVILLFGGGYLSYLIAEKFKASWFQRLGLKDKMGRSLVLSLLLVTVLLQGLRDTQAWAWRFALDARDIQRHPVAMGGWIKEHLSPEASVIAVHDAGAMPYVSGFPRFIDLVGLGTNGMGRWYRGGPGCLFERLERFPLDERPTHYAVYPDWFKNVDILSARIHSISLKHRSIVPNATLMLYSARNDRFGTGHSPWLPLGSWKTELDAVDFADLISEAEHETTLDAPRGPTEYLRGLRPDGSPGGDGCRWLRSSLEFDLSCGEGASEGAHLVLRLASTSGSTVHVDMGGGAPHVIKVRAGRSLADYRVPFEAECPGTTRYRVSKESGQYTFIARAYLVH